MFKVGDIVQFYLPGSKVQVNGQVKMILSKQAILVEVTNMLGSEQFRVETKKATFLKAGDYELIKANGKQKADRPEKAG